VIRYAIEASSVTAADPADVLAVLDDFAGWPNWMPSLESVRVVLPEQGLPTVGYRFELRGRIAAAVLEVTQFTPLVRETRFRLNFPPLSGANRFELVPLADGRHRILRVDELELPNLVAHLIDATQRRRFEQLAGEFLTALRRAVEQRS
jgi:hypothetical protein